VAIFIPRWGRFKDKKQSGPVDVNWNNDLTRGLTFLSGFGPKDLVGNVTETLTADITKRDNDYLFNSRTSTNPGVNYGDICDYYTNGLTATVVCRCPDWSNKDTSSLMALISKSEASGLVGRWALYVENSTIVGINRATGIANNTVSGDYTNKLFNSKTHVISYASTPAINNIFLDGLLFSTASGDGVAVAGTTLSLRLGAYANNNASYYGRFLGEIHIAYVHSRQLSADEEKEIGIYPYQLLKPRNQFFFLGSANETAGIQLTTVNPTVSIGASQTIPASLNITTTNPTIESGLSQTLHANLALTTANPIIALAVNEGQVNASVALTTQNPVISARITGGEPDFVLGGVPLRGEVKRGKRRWDPDEEYEAEYNENIPVDNPIIKLDGSVTKIKESMDYAKKQADKKDEDDVKAIVQFVKQYRSNIISTWLN